jgi:hypothetical protein
VDCRLAELRWHCGVCSPHLRSQPSSLLLGDRFDGPGDQSPQSPSLRSVVQGPALLPGGHRPNPLAAPDPGTGDKIAAARCPVVRLDGARRANSLFYRISRPTPRQRGGQAHLSCQMPRKDALAQTEFDLVVQRDGTLAIGRLIVYSFSVLLFEAL